MKLATVVVDGHYVVALVDPESSRVWLLDEILGYPIDTMLDIIAGYDGLRDRLKPRGDGRALSEIHLAAPVLPPRNLLCVGKNYRDHALEFSNSGFDRSDVARGDGVPTAPIIFTKAPTTIIGNGEAIRYPHGVSECVDYEAELAVVIGKGGRGITKANAFEHIFGYTIVNDVTARDLQARHKQWFIGKSIDTFCPMGPWLVTRDEIDVSDLQISCWVNAERRQHASTRDLIFDIPTLIETISAGMTLLPGDVIATGTPAGVGIGFDPPRFLQPGDEIAIEITGIGRLANRLA